MKIPIKFSITFSIIILASMAIVSFFSIQYLESALIDSELQEMEKIIELKEQQIENLHTQASQNLIFAMKNPLFVEYFELPETKAGNQYRDGVLQYTEKQHQIKTDLEQWIFHFQNKFDVDETCIIDLTGQEHARLVLSKVAPVDELSSEESSASFFAPSFEKNLDEVHIQYPYVSPDTLRWVFAYTSPVVLGDEKPAIYHFEMPLRIFQDIVNIDSGRLYVIDPNGYIIADSDDASVANAQFNENTDIDQFDPSKYFPNTQSVSATSEYSSIVEQMFKNDSGQEVYSGSDEQTFLVYHKLPTFDWVLVYEKPSSILLGGNTTLDELESIIILIALITAASGIIVVIALSLTISRPITRLSNWCKSQNVSKLKTLEIDTNDEIGDVSKSLNQMIHKIIEYEKQINSQIKELKSLDVKKDEFASMVTHELKTPLTPILGFATMLKKKEMIGTLNPKQESAIDSIFSNAKHLNRLVGDLLDAEKLELGMMKFDNQKIDANDLINNVIKNAKNTYSEKKIKIQNTTSEDELFLYSDEGRLRQVLDNLIYNAIDFVAANTGKIEVNAQKKDSGMQFFVKDNGIGISEEAQSRLFNKFYQVDTSRKRKHGGTGLGLSICSGIITALGGKIWVESIKGEGTTFYFTLESRNI